ncbi:hypothetical protein Bca52824_060621 [Brassica carinata]|uniref:Uncharacterized protein n=1 Tax=Brassica carinata TaxID=52824 RepID=A0A8X7QXV0_BRACI|nr:hypothetical protein Bca52824_060621 [Brassica carinata]
MGYGIRYFHVSVASTAMAFVGPQVWPELSLDRLRADGLIAKNISLRDSEDELEMLLGKTFRKAYNTICKQAKLRPLTMSPLLTLRCYTLEMEACLKAGNAETHL